MLWSFAYMSGFGYYILWMYLLLMTWLLEVYAIFPLWCFIVEIFMHVNIELFEDVTSISWIFIIFAWFIALIEVGRYWSLVPLMWWFAHVAYDDWTHFVEKWSLQNILIFKKVPAKCFVFDILQGPKTTKKIYKD